MNAESESAPVENSRISKHPFVVLGIVLTACLGPFINKAVHMDDALFIWTGQWIQRHPADFFGFDVNWWGSATPMWVANCNPPLMSYFLAGVAALFGWNEMVLHLAGLAVAFLAAAGIYSLAKLWCDQPLLAALVAVFTPVFLVSSSTLMCDVLMLAFWIWSLVFWERALKTENGGWQFIGAGALAGLAVLTKYSVVTLLPLLPLMSLVRKRKPGWWLAGAAVPWLMIMGYEWLTARLYGKGLLAAATAYAQAHRSLLVGGWTAREVVALAFAGGSLLPLLFFSPWLWPRRAWWRGGAIVFGVLLGLFWLGGDPGIFHPLVNPESFNHPGFRLQVILLLAGGLHLLLLVAAETWRRRDAVAVILALWIAVGLLFAGVLNWTVSARSFLPIVPAAAILLVRRLDATRGNGPAAGWWSWPLIPSAAIALSLMLADYQMANSARKAAKQIAARYQPAGHTLWFEQHMGFQYYMEKSGARPVDCERSVLQPGDVVVVPRINYGFIPFPLGSVGWLDPLIYRPFSLLNLSRDTPASAAGFYSATWGPVPFALGRLPPQEFFLLKVFSKIQFNTQPFNPQAVLDGDVPVFADYSAVSDDRPAVPENPEVEKLTLLAGQLEADGKLEAAIQQYRQALEVDAGNPVLLNNLAWILATADQPALRNGEEAMRLATQAVKLSDRRQPLFMGTLGAACSAAGQFEQAIQAAEAAETFALLTNQKELAIRNRELLGQYAAGKTAGALSTR
jgi:4-amino-4-deoxy-L-arabinose transferase-like glycosyltransferase